LNAGGISTARIGCWDAKPVSSRLTHRIARSRCKKIKLPKPWDHRQKSDRDESGVRILRVYEQGERRCGGHEFVQQLQPFCEQQVGKISDARNIAAWPV
jgi:hypothetical protein